MKLALCLEYPIEERGGVCVLVETLLRELVRQGHEMVLVSPDTPDSLRVSEAGRLVREHIRWQPLPRPTMANARRLARQLADARVDLAHFHFGGNYGWGNRFPFHCPVIFLARFGVPCVSTVHLAVSLTHGYSDPRWPLWYKLLRLPLAWWGKMQQLRHVRREIAVSQHDYQHLRRWYRPLKRRFVQVYHSRLAQSEMPAGTLGCASDGGAAAPPCPREKIILSAGHVARRKGQPVLAEAFARIARRYPDWKLCIAGPVIEPECRQEIEAAGAKCSRSGQISLLGHRDDAAQLMSRAAIFVQPSYFEGLPLALQEALYYGCACVATRIPGNVELIEHESNGLLVPLGDSEELSRALERLLQDGDLQARLAAKGRSSILKKEMTAPQMTRKHLDLYAAVLAKG